MSSKYKRSYSSNIDIASRQANALVFEFGTAYLRIGIAGECKPRRIFPLSSSPVASLSPTLPLSERASAETKPVPVSTTAEDYWSSSCNFPQDLFLFKSSPGYEDLGPWLRNVYTYHLLLKPRSRRVLVLLPIYHPPGLKSALEAIFLKQLQVPSLLFTHQFETIPYAIGETNAGIIVDIGKDEGRIVCFFNGNMCEDTLQIVPIGYQVLLKGIKACDSDKISSNDAIQHGAKQQVMEDFFFDLDNPNSLMYAFLSCLLECPMDLRKLVVQHIVFVGGGVEGVSHYLEHEFLKAIQALFVQRKKVQCTTSQNNVKETTIYGITNEKHKQFDKLATAIMTAPLGIMYPLQFRPLSMAWIGASIMGSIQLSDDKWIHRFDSE